MIPTFPGRYCYLEINVNARNLLRLNLYSINAHTNNAFDFFLTSMKEDPRSSSFAMPYLSV